MWSDGSECLYLIKIRNEFATSTSMVIVNIVDTIAYYSNDPDHVSNYSSLHSAYCDDDCCINIYLKKHCDNVDDIEVCRLQIHFKYRLFQ